MPNMLATVTLGHQSGIPEDAVVNTFAFKAASGTAASHGPAILSALADFYTMNVGGLAAVHDIIGGTVVRTTGTSWLRLYDVTGKEAGKQEGDPPGTNALGSPVYETDFTIGGSSATTSLPAEIAIALSFHATLTNVLEEGPANSRPAARRRGRVFIGPVNPAYITLSDAVDAVVASSARSILTGAAERLRDDPDVDWSVWSRKDATFRTVVGGFVDNAVDVQRKRGTKATSRTLW